MKNIVLFILIFLNSLNIFSQKSENYVWYFGVQAGLDFNGGEPVEITGGQINTREGVASICNSSGEIIFYTEGTTVWNRNHQIMPNGRDLEGSYTSTESAVICQAPGFPNKYYIFTVPYTIPGAEGNWALYSIVDMTLDNNNGDVTQKNQNLFPNSSEKIIVVQHANKSDYWIIGHECSPEGSDVFHTALLDANGLHINPLDIEIGITIKDDYQATGYLKVSPDGTTIAMALGASTNSSMGYVNILKFNNQTGEILGPSIVLHEDVRFPYGIEFSPDSRFLYVSDLNAWDLDQHDAIFQYDLSVFEENAIKQSMNVIYHVYSKMHYGALQLGPNGKIYIGKEFGYNKSVNHIGVINQPNRKGAFCDYDDQGILLQNTQTLIGFPTFTGSAGYIKSNPEYACAGEEVTLTLNSTNNYDVHWFIDGCPQEYSQGVATGRSVTFVVPSVPYTYYAREYNGTSWEPVCYAYLILEPEEVEVPIVVSPVTINCTESINLNDYAIGSDLIWFEDECSDNINLSLNPPIVSPISNTSYFVRKNNCAGMSDCNKIDIIVNSSLTMSYTPPEYVHKCKPVEFDITFDEGTAPWSFKYTIDNGDENIVDAPSSPFTFVIEEPGEYQFYDLQDANECISDQSFDPFVIQEVPCPSVATYYEAECYMDNITFEINTGIVCNDLVRENIQIGTPDNSSLTITDIIMDPACDGLPGASGRVFTIIFDREVFVDGYYPVTINGPITDIYNLTIDEISFTFSLANCGDDVLVCEDCISGFSPLAGEKYILNAWTMEEGNAGLTDVNSQLVLVFEGTGRSFTFTPNGTVIDGWQQINGEFEAPANADAVTVKLVNLSPQKEVYFDDIRIFPVDGTMKSYVYDPVSMKLMAELDENNYATFYEYDEEGRLIRIKRETERGIVTIQENSTHMNAVLNQIRE